MKKKNKIIILFILVLLLAICFALIMFYLSFNKKKGSPVMEIYFSWDAYNYCGGTEEAYEDEIGDLIADNCHYTIKDHDATDWQKEGWNSSYKANIYMLKGHNDYQTLIVENHKGKLVKAYFSQLSSNATLYDALRLYGFSTETIDSITITNVNTGLSSSLNEETSIIILELLNKNYDMFPFGIELVENTYNINIKLTNKTSWLFSIDLTADRIEFDDNSYELDSEFSRTFKSIIPEELVSDN